MFQSYPSMTFTEVLEQAASGALLLTANNRLARELRSRYDRWQWERGAAVWERPQILPWGTWLRSRYELLLELGVCDRRLLTPQQSRLLWEQVIREGEGPGFEVLLQAGSIARSAEQAWRLTIEWRMERNRMEEWATPETAEFLRWADRYLQQCLRQNWIDQAALPDLVSAHLGAGEFPLPQRMVLAGFDVFTPQQQQLFATLQERGCGVAVLAFGEVSGALKRVALADAGTELKTAIRWAARRLERNPEARIGLVIPKLAELREQVVSELERVLHPEAILPGGSHLSSLYNLSLGRPLSRYPVVGDALLLLELARGELSCTGIGRLLRSPFLMGAESEWLRRARLDARMRDRIGEREITLGVLLRQIQSVADSAAEACPVLERSFRNFRSELDRLPRRGEPAVWAGRFLALLDAAGWPNGGYLNSEEYQPAQRFRELLEHFPELGLVQRSMTFEAALGRLRALCSDTLFQPESPEAPIQVVGLLEAAGLAFDHLWVLGLSDDQWPEAASPHPLLPVRLQRELGIPRATAERELEFATQVTRRLCAGAPEVVMSYPCREGERELRASPLLTELPELKPEELDLYPSGDLAILQFGSGEPELLEDRYGPPLEPHRPVAGGTRLFADQSDCPFRAFANHRLGADPVAEPESGLDARNRGNLIHDILDQVWKELREQATLLAASDAELDGIVSTAVDQSLRRLEPRRPLTLTPRFTELERERLILLVRQWLELEKQRAPFRVEVLEQKRQTEIGGLAFHLKADRIDRLADGSLAIIDYKTGNDPKSIQGWLQERMEEPQLPLYACTTEQGAVSSLLLGRVRSGRVGFLGASRDEETAPGVKAFAASPAAREYASWDALLESWRIRLEHLAKEILAGRAEVDPKDPAKTCRYCPLPPLCRIHERGRGWNLSPEEGP
jgi:ATP-dependent helicase/nuclease subunit B